MLKRFLFVAITFAILACNSDDNINPLEEEVAVAEDVGFYALKIGNSYSYLGYKRDGVLADDLMELNGIEYSLTITDTAIIDGEKYFERTFFTTGNDSDSSVFPLNGESIDYVRDSIGYLINSDGEILFSQTNPADYLITDQDWGDLFGVFNSEVVDIEAPAGTFSCYGNTLYAILTDTTEPAPGRAKRFYSDGIGFVTEHMGGVSNPVHIWETRLASYSVD